jgi:hypothetical protein
VNALYSTSRRDVNRRGGTASAEFWDHRLRLEIEVAAALKKL